uniref:Universal stress protein n=1 Tax=Roseihalotalea indica TaxID=2867963 RepID=A0AA49JK71_9BACT|nr:universal stress protein [Tunicatimonas sp. TK19036]
MLNKILCPVDFSESSLNAVEFAAKLGAAHKASLTLIHVFTEDEFGSALSSQKLPDRFKQDDVDNLVGHAEDMIEHLAKEVYRLEVGKGLVACDYHFTYGPLERQIVDYAEEHQYSIIVMGTSGVKDVFEEYVGSNTVKTIERAHCPVLCVPDSVEYRPPKNIMYATNYQEEDTKALARLSLFAKPFQAQVHIVHMCHEKNLMEKATYNDFQDQIKSSIPYTNIQFEEMECDDDTVHGIDQYAIDHNMDMVALLHHRRSFFERLFESSKVKDISYFATYPVLVYRES